MTQSPQSGQTAPRSTGHRSVTGPAHSTAPPPTTAPPPAKDVPTNGGGQWGAVPAPSGPPAAPAQNPAFGGAVHADAPTGSMPYVSGTAFPKTAGTPPPSAPPSQPRTARTTRPRGPRRARLQLRHINPWTVLKFSCVLSIALFFVWLIVIGVLFGILDAAGIISSVNDTIVQLNGTGSKAPVTAGIVFGGAAIIGVVNVVLFIALSTIGSVVYNLCADLVGGIEITLSER